MHRIHPHLAADGIKIGVIFENYVTAGTTVKGHVTLVSDRELVVTAVKVQFTGKAMTFGAFRRMDPTMDTYAYTHDIGSEVELMDETVVLLEGEHQLLSKGDHSFPFSVKFPPDLPASFDDGDDAYGCIVYHADVTISRQGGTDLDMRRKFEVSHPLHLFRVSHAEDPIQVHREKLIKGCCIDSGTVDVHITSKKTGYIPGETMKYEVQIDNSSSLTINRAHCSLCRRVICKGKSKHGKETEKKFDDKHLYDMFDVTMDCTPGDSENLGERSYVIPELPPSYYEGCDLIDLIYYIQLKLSFRKSLQSVRVQHEIIIGTTATPEHLHTNNNNGPRRRRMSFQMLVKSLLWE